MSNDSEAVAPVGTVPVPSPAGSASKATVRTETERPGTEHPDKKHPSKKHPATTAADKETVFQRGSIPEATARTGGESICETVSVPGAETAPGPKVRPDNHLEALCGALAVACVLFALVWGFALLNAIIG